MPQGGLRRGDTKDLVEARLFARRRSLFTDLSVVFMDTTSLYFEGEGGATLGERGHSKDYRPHLNQMIVGVIIGQDGRPICSEMWPGNTADVTTLIPVIDRLRNRFAIDRVCVVADRGMISGATIAALCLVGGRHVGRAAIGAAATRRWRIDGLWTLAPPRRTARARISDRVPEPLNHSCRRPLQRWRGLILLRAPAFFTARSRRPGMTMYPKPTPIPALCWAAAYRHREREGRAAARLV